MILVGECEINGTKIRAYLDGRIARYYKKGWRLLTNKILIQNNYKIIQNQINYKIYIASRVIYKCFNPDFDLDNPKLQIDHINRDSTDNRICNLRVVTNQQNSFNKNAKGYHFHKLTKKWQASIALNNKIIYLGLFDTEDEAKTTYLNAKKKYHVIT